MKYTYKKHYILVAAMLSVTLSTMARPTNPKQTSGNYPSYPTVSMCASELESSICANKNLDEKGVSQELAILRSKEISQVKYQVRFDIPSDKSEWVKGHVAISFDFSPSKENVPFWIDFQGHALSPSCMVNGKQAPTEWKDEHIQISRPLLKKGKNVIELDFESDHTPLNRHEDYLYTLFVPDHARAAMPCFDQPDLKACFSLQLKLPTTWKAISSGSIVKDSVIVSNVTSQKASEANTDTASYKLLQFSETRPLPTYLFSFTAGKFQEETAVRDGRQLSCLYRETDPDKVAQLDEVMDEIALSLRWMEAYTGIPYPFEKYGFVMIPSYQFGGMEHPGAIQYNDRTVFIGKNPTLDERLHRLELLAHETAHMWFGDLVTMRWFNDVWTKEVFANYLASKVAREQFPNVNHDLSFLKAYQIPALSTDRTEGTHPIQQPLENLNLAGLLYGNIIYDKSPVMMRKLEEQMGSEAFQKGLQTYLHTYAYGNATWDGLIDILSKASPTANLEQFSQVWVKQKGMPEITMEEKNGNIVFHQHDKYNRGIFWPQSFQMGAWKGSNLKVYNVNMQDSIVALSKKEVFKRLGIKKPSKLFLNMDGKGYGRFVLNQKEIPDWTLLPEVNRLAVLMSLYENYWMGRMDDETLFTSMYHGLSIEKNPLVASACCNYLSTIVRNMKMEARKKHEKELFELSQKHTMPAVRQLLLKRLYGSAISPEVVDSLYQIWKNQTENLLNERDYMSMSYHLTLMLPQQWKEITTMQLERLTSEDRKKEYRFISRACNPDTKVQDELFEELKQKENRRTEPWAETLLALLNDETREPHNNQYVKPGLDLLEEVQRTGDIFFPGYWVNSLLGGHRSQEAKKIVEDFINAHPDYPQKLKNKLLEAAFILMNKK